MAKKSRNQARLHRHARVRKNIFGTPERPRMNVFRSISDIYVQIIDDHSGTTLVSASSVDSGLRASLAGKSKVEQALLVGEEVSAAKVTASVVKNGKAKKVIVFKYKSKKDYRKKQGHRQPYTKVKIESISL